MTREKFIEELNFNCKVDGKEVWLNIMPCLEKLLDEHEAQLKAKNERIRELEEAIKPKTCNECEWWDFNSYGIFKKCFNGKGNCVSTKSSFGCNRFKQKDNA